MVGLKENEFSPREEASSLLRLGQVCPEMWVQGFSPGRDEATFRCLPSPHLAGRTQGALFVPFSESPFRFGRV